MRSGLILATCTWLACIALAAMPVVRHQFTRGMASDAGQWPAASAIPRGTAEWTLVMVVHARCPCAQASLAELAQVATRAPRLRIAVVVVTPPGVAADDALARRAARIHGVEVIPDDGSEAARFGVSTSGHALLFAGSGRLAYSGGITASRGHQGANAGEDAVVAIALGQAAQITAAPVFGCALAGPSEPVCSHCSRAVPP